MLSYSISNTSSSILCLLSKTGQLCEGVCLWDSKAFLWETRGWKYDSLRQGITFHFTHLKPIAVWVKMASYQMATSAVIANDQCCGFLVGGFFGLWRKEQFFSYVKESFYKSKAFLCDLRSHIFTGILGYYFVRLSLELSSKHFPEEGCLEAFH